MGHFNGPLLDSSADMYSHTHSHSELWPHSSFHGFPVKVCLNERVRNPTYYVAADIYPSGALLPFLPWSCVIVPSVAKHIDIFLLKQRYIYSFLHVGCLSVGTALALGLFASVLLAFWRRNCHSVKASHFFPLGSVRLTPASQTESRDVRLHINMAVHPELMLKKQLWLGWKWAE